MATNKKHEKRYWRVENTKTGEVLEDYTSNINLYFDTNTKELEEGAKTKKLIRGKYLVEQIEMHEKNKKQKQLSLEEFDRQAREKGMSYGQYSAFLESLRMKEERERRKALAI